MKPGDILLIEQIHQDTANTPLLASPAWALVLSFAPFGKRHVADLEWLTEEWNDRASEIGERVYALYTDIDSYTVVPEDEVPDEIWAELAKRRLSA